MLRKVFKKSPRLAEFADFRSALLVGKANYLCDNRLEAAMKGQTDLFETYQRAELERIREWAADGPKEGISQELSPSPKFDVWDAVNAYSSVCSNKRCSPETCCYRRARSRVDKAHLLVVNHSLLFALVGKPRARQGGKNRRPFQRGKAKPGLVIRCAEYRGLIYPYSVPKYVGSDTSLP